MMVDALLTICCSYSMFTTQLCRTHTTSTIAVRERIRKSQKNVTIRIPFCALSEEMQKQLIEFEEDEREHKRRYAARKLAYFEFLDDDFDAFRKESEDSESGMSRYLTCTSAKEEKRT